VAHMASPLRHSSDQSHASMFVFFSFDVPVCFGVVAASLSAGARFRLLLWPFSAFLMLSSYCRSALIALLSYSERTYYVPTERTLA